VRGERANEGEAHIQQVRRGVNPAAARGRRSNLPREICGRSQNVTEGEALHSDRGAEGSRGGSAPEKRRKAGTVPGQGNQGKRPVSSATQERTAAGKPARTRGAGLCDGE